MDFVKGQLVRSKAGRDKTRTYAVLDVVLGNELLKSDQPISDAIKAYDAEHPF